ncbi:hypothetical protein Agabi119p4_894 [Agaricus bisporus var. burnettii]|uniref:Uncharacterized protein n=1 Tax=Agaricus bisporus var. burnettii TaxID=192524 RepID=A0A8H7FBK4_AGABI|nr:hypothetical protein Agabi119p4_894 [Agaricus bisporus var. burnettii]
MDTLIVTVIRENRTSGGLTVWFSFPPVHSPIRLITQTSRSLPHSVLHSSLHLLGCLVYDPRYLPFTPSFSIFIAGR